MTVTEKLAVRDWLGELVDAIEREDLEGFRRVAKEIAVRAPWLKDNVLDVTVEYVEDGVEEIESYFDPPEDKSPTILPPIEADVELLSDVEAKPTEPAPAVERAKLDAALAKRPQPPKEEPKKAAVVELKPVAELSPKETAKVPLRTWSEVVIPKGVSEVEALSYVPGLVGDITKWTLVGAKRPNRMMALGTGLVTVGTLIGQRVQGPTESATHLFIIIIAQTGYGKDWPLMCGVRLFEALGLSDHLGPSEWASSPGLWKRLKRNSVLVCFVDELGDELELVNSQGANAFVSKIIGTLKKCYNAFSVQFTAEKVGEESEKITWPSPSIIGASTPEKFYNSVKPADLESGFANRLLILPMEGFRRPPEQLTSRGAADPPKDLVKQLKKLWRPISVLDWPRPKQDLIGWGPEAGEIYQAFSAKMDQFEHTDNMKYQLGMRVCENAVRLATIVACGRGSPTVDREDIAWALKLGELSFDAACSNYDKYMRQYFEFPVFCRKVLEGFEAAGGRMSDRELERKFGRNQKWGNELGRVKDQLQREGYLRKGEWRDGERGPWTQGWELVRD
jgi:hypothetical protein